MYPLRGRILDGAGRKRLVIGMPVDGQMPGVTNIDPADVKPPFGRNCLPSSVPSKRRTVLNFSFLQREHSVRLQNFITQSRVFRCTETGAVTWILLFSCSSPRFIPLGASSAVDLLLFISHPSSLLDFPPPLCPPTARERLHMCTRKNISKDTQSPLVVDHDLEPLHDLLETIIQLATRKPPPKSENSRARYAGRMTHLLHQSASAFPASVVVPPARTAFEGAVDVRQGEIERFGFSRSSR